MKINPIMKVELNESEVQTIVREFVARELDVDADRIDVDIQVGTRLEGFGPIETSVTRFRKIVATVKPGTEQ